MLVQLVSALQREGMPQHVVAIGTPDDYRGKLEACGVAVTVLGLRSAAGGAGAPFRLASLIKQLQPDVLQGWMYHGNVLAALGHRLAKGYKSRKLYWNLRASNMDDARYGRIIRASALLSRWPDAVIANSAAGLAYHISRGFRPRRGAVIANGIDTDLFRPDPAARGRLRGELGIAQDAIVAIHVARLDPMKNHAGFLAAMGRVPAVTGLMVGTGTERLQLPHNVRALGQRSDVAALFACADLVVSTSAFGEGFSNAIAEGMSAGLIPIATDVGDARQIVGDAGYVVSPRDPEILAKTLAIEAATPDRPARGLRARARIEQHFTLARALDCYATLYASGHFPAAVRSA
jgi:glycosyltransferase involved in cell wall biosynthesis